MKPTSAKPRGKSPEPAETGPPSASSSVSSSPAVSVRDTIPDSAVALPYLPSFAEALLARNAVLPPISTTSSAVNGKRGAAFWDLGYPYWSSEQFYNLVLSELTPQGQYIIFNTELQSITDLLDILAVIAPKHSLRAIWYAVNET